MDAREERGMHLAMDRRVKKIAGTTWLVPSQTQSSGGYVVDEGSSTCTCPDYELHRVKCKHQWAVEISQLIELVRGETVITDTFKITRKTYTQDWPSYNSAQCSEKDMVQQLLHTLCEGVATPAHPGRGPKSIPLGDIICAMSMKVYTTASGRRAAADIEACAEKGHMGKAPRYNTLFGYFERSDITPILTRLVEDSAAPLASLESSFAIDSTGFGTTTYRRWYDKKYGHEVKEHGWVKAHASVGTITHVITAIHVTDCDSNDSVELPGLLESTARNFKPEEISADKAYLGHDNLAAIEAAGAVPYIPFKVNSQGDGPEAWRRMWGFFTYKKGEFLSHYHKRSNVESTFSALKRKFGAAIRSKTFTAQTNEILCKALCFNLSMIVHAILEFGITPAFPVFGVPS
jgi:transposase